VKIFDNPACQDKQIYNSYKGHSSHITGVKWSFDDKYLISTGGLEKSIIQWTNTNEEEINYDFDEVPEQKEKKPVENAENEDDYEFTQLDDYKEQ
jgi:WD40 repeat protein